MPKAPLRRVRHPSRKVCKHCQVIQPIHLFEKKPTETTYRNICRPCRNKANRITRKLRTDHIKKHGFPTGKPCEICEKELPLVFDHCHETLLFRGWLCRHCNVAVGKLGDNLEGLRKAIRYLEGYRDRLACAKRLTEMSEMV